MSERSELSCRWSQQEPELFRSLLSTEIDLEETRPPDEETDVVHLRKHFAEGGKDGDTLVPLAEEGASKVIGVQVPVPRNLPGFPHPLMLRRQIREVSDENGDATVKAPVEAEPERFQVDLVSTSRTTLRGEANASADVV